MPFHSLTMVRKKINADKTIFYSALQVNQVESWLWWNQINIIRHTSGDLASRLPFRCTNTGIIARKSHQLCQIKPDTVCITWTRIHHFKVGLLHRSYERMNNWEQVALMLSHRSLTDLHHGTSKIIRKVIKLSFIIFKRYKLVGNHLFVQLTIERQISFYFLYLICCKNPSLEFN